MICKQCQLNWTNNALTVNAGLLHKNHSNITLGIVGEPITKKFLVTGISAANPLLSNFTPGVETNVFQQSNMTQSYEDEYEDIEQIEDFVAFNFVSDSWVNNDEALKEDVDDNNSFLWCPVSNLIDGSAKISDLIKWFYNKTQGKLTPIWWDLSAAPTVYILS